MIELAFLWTKKTLMTILEMYADNKSNIKISLILYTHTYQIKLVGDSEKLWSGLFLIIVNIIIQRFGVMFIKYYFIWIKKEKCKIFTT